MSLTTDPQYSNGALLEGSQALPTRPSNDNNITTKMSMGHWWNDIDRGKPKFSEETLSPYRFCEG